ncbi:MAG: hypothetical protein JOZ82_03685, partial [Marmoricola sp.]|nr:hypothetical protein [Marmoricola sp.]
DGTYDAVFFGWQANTTAVTGDVAIYTSGGGSNFVGFDNKNVDSLYTKLQETTDPNAQIPIVTDIEKEMWKDAIGMPIFQFPAAVMWDKTTVSNVNPIAFSPTMFYGFYDWKPGAK